MSDLEFGDYIKKSNNVQAFPDFEKMKNKQHARILKGLSSVEKVKGFQMSYSRAPALYDAPADLGI
jgi:hypothetical protein